MSARSCGNTTRKHEQFAAHVERYKVAVYLWPEPSMVCEENRDVDDDGYQKGRFES